MLFPGADLIINTTIAILFLIACGLLGCVSGMIFYNLGPWLTKRTETYQRMVQGYKGDYDKWWLHESNWFKAGWWAGFVIWVYCLFGPVYALMKYIGDL